VLAASAVDREFEPWSGQTNDFKIGNVAASYGKGGFDLSFDKYQMSCLYY